MDACSRKTPADADPVYFLYAQEQLIAQKQGRVTAKLHFDGQFIRGRSVDAGGETGSEINGLDPLGGVITRTAEDGETTRVMYTPYGESVPHGSVPPDQLAAHPSIAFNGQHLDVLAQLYHLGAGQRAYSPELMIFLSPDPLSPFGGGGFNAYAYCAGDPINMTDPDGTVERRRECRRVGRGIVAGDRGLHRGDRRGRSHRRRIPVFDRLGRRHRAQVSAR